MTTFKREKETNKENPQQICIFRILLCFWTKQQHNIIEHIGKVILKLKGALITKTRPHWVLFAMTAPDGILITVGDFDTFLYPFFPSKSYH